MIKNWKACNSQQFILPIAYNNDDIFTGWYTDSACTVQLANNYGVMNANIDGYTDSNGAWIGENKTLYAGWVEVLDLYINITNNLTNQLYDGYIIVQIGEYATMISLPRNKTTITLTLKEVEAGDLTLRIKLYGDITVQSDKLVISDNQRYCFATVLDTTTISLTLTN